MRTVVGVVSDIVQNDLNRQEFSPLVYVPYRQRPSPEMNVFIRSRVAPEPLAQSVRREVQALDPGLPDLARTVHAGGPAGGNGLLLEPRDRCHSSADSSRHRPLARFDRRDAVILIP